MNGITECPPGLGLRPPSGALETGLKCRAGHALGSRLQPLPVHQNPTPPIPSLLKKRPNFFDHSVDLFIG